MNLSYRPIRSTAPLFADFNRMLGSVDANANSYRWQPALELRKTENGFLMQLDIPGVDPSSVDIAIENRTLTISGRRLEAEAGDDVVRSERQTGEFQRSFNLADDINPESIKARSEYGVLSVELQRKESELPRKISVDLAE